MPYVGIALISVISGIGGGLLTYGLTQPSWEQAAEIIATSPERNIQNALGDERRRAEDRSALMGVGVGFLSCAATAVALSFLKTVVDHNRRGRPGG
jgi:hypothetical protein